MAPRALATLTAAMRAISDDLDANWRAAPNAEALAVEDALSVLDEALGTISAALQRTAEGVA